MIGDMPTLTATQAAALLRRLTMAEMRALLAIRSAGSVTRAALALRVSQPALSQQLRDVEAKLDQALFIRHRRGLEPTPAGEVMLRLARALGEDMRMAAQELALTSGANTRPLRVGSMALTSAGLLAVALGRLAEQSPHDATIVLEGSRETLLEELRHRRIDLFIGRLPDAEEVSDLISETLFLDAGVVIASARHTLTRRGKVTVAHLQAWGWIMPAEDTTFYKQIAQSLRASGLTLPPARIHSFSMLAIPAVVASSNLLGFLPSSMFGAGALSGGLQRLPAAIEWTASPVGILRRRDDHASDRIDGFLHILRSVAASARGALLQTP